MRMIAMKFTPGSHFQDGEKFWGSGGVGFRSFHTSGFWAGCSFSPERADSGDPVAGLGQREDTNHGGAKVVVPCMDRTQKGLGGTFLKQGVGPCLFLLLGSRVAGLWGPTISRCHPPGVSQAIESGF